MAKTIGIEIKKQLQTLVEQKYDKYRTGYEIRQRVILASPGEWFKVWEGAWLEICQLIDEGINKIKEEAV